MSIMALNLDLKQFKSGGDNWWSTMVCYPNPLYSEDMIRIKQNVTCFILGNGPTGLRRSGSQQPVSSPIFEIRTPKYEVGVLST